MGIEDVNWEDLLPEKPPSTPRERRERRPVNVGKVRLFSCRWSGRRLEVLARHPLYGSKVREWMKSGRRDWARMKSNLANMEMKVRLQKRFLKAYGMSGDEVGACEEAGIGFMTFVKWKTIPEFRTLYEGLREMRAMKTLQVAREQALKPDATVDRWNILRTEIPDYNPKRRIEAVGGRGDIEFTPKGLVGDGTIEAEVVEESNG